MIVGMRDAALIATIVGKELRERLADRSLVLDVNQRRVTPAEFARKVHWNPTRP